MNEISRLLTLVPFITRHQGISISELARDFAVTEKEIRKDLMTLFMCGLPGYTPLELMEVDFENGFVTIRNAETLQKPRALTTEELLLVILGLSLLHEVESNFAHRIERLLNHLRSFISIPIEIASDQTLATWKLFNSAIRKKRQVSFTYTSRYSDEEKDHEVSPIEVFVQGSTRYLRGFSHTSGGVRTYDVARVHNSVILDKPLDVVSTEEERLTVEIAIKKRYRKFIEFFQAEKFDTFSDKWAVRAVISAGGDVELLKPERLRKTIVEAAKSALAEYEGLR